MSLSLSIDTKMASVAFCPLASLRNFSMVSKECMRVAMKAIYQICLSLQELERKLQHKPVALHYYQQEREQNPLTFSLEMLSKMLFLYHRVLFTSHLNSPYQTEHFSPRALPSKKSSNWHCTIPNNRPTSFNIGCEGDIHLMMLKNEKTTFYTLSPEGEATKKCSLREGLFPSLPTIDSEDVIYVSSTDGKIYVIPPGEATEIEELILEDEALLSSPVIGPKGMIYVSSINGEIRNISSEREELWSLTLEKNHPISLPAVGPKNVIYASSTKGSIYAISPQGTLLWSLSLNENISHYFFSIDSKGIIYACSKEGEVYAISPQGTLLWKLSLNNALIQHSPVPGPQGIIYVVSDKGELYVLSTEGKIKHQIKIAPSFNCRCALIIKEQFVYILPYLSNKLYVISPPFEGKQQYLQIENSISLSNLVINPEGTLYILSHYDDRQTLYKFSPQNLKKKLKYIGE